MTGKRAILRKTYDTQGSRYLAATLTADGVLTIEGLDRGKGVEEFFGMREYEWRWTIAPADVERLAEALGSKNVLAALRKRFFGDAAADLQPFLDEQCVPYEAWSRIGD